MKLIGVLIGLPIAIAVLSYMFKARLAPTFRLIWAALDRLYMAAGLVAALAMISILVIIIWQMVARWVGFTFEGSTEFAGYAMAATSFFALAHAFSRGAHIRVSIFLNLKRLHTVLAGCFCAFCGRVDRNLFCALRRKDKLHV